MYSMNLELETSVEPDFVRITVGGKYRFEEMFDFIELLRKTADQARRKVVLIDCRRVEGSMTEAERFQGGQKIAEVFGARLKAALLMPVDQITKLGELTAVNRGAKFLVTKCEDEAKDWLFKH